MSLAEVMVAAALMSVITAVATAALVTTYRTFGRADAAATAGQQIAVAFQKLDHDVRYASAVSTPALVGGDAYVEYLTLLDSTWTCVELRLRTSEGRLQRRAWPSGTTVSSSAWTPLASGVKGGADAPSVTMPFIVSQADEAYGYDRLRISLRADAGQGPAAAHQTFSVTFPAVNSAVTESEDQPCVAGRSVP